MQVKEHVSRIGKDIAYLKKTIEHHNEMLESLTNDSIVLKLPYPFDADAIVQMTRTDWIDEQLKGISDWKDLLDCMMETLDKDVDSVMKTVHECASVPNSCEPPEGTDHECTDEVVSLYVMKMVQF